MRGQDAKQPGSMAIFSILAALCVLYWLSKPTDFFVLKNILPAVAQLAALLGLALFALSFILTSRLSLLERGFGDLGRAYHVHHRAGVWAFSLLIVHFFALLTNWSAKGIPVASLIINSRVLGIGLLALAAMAIIAVTIIFTRVPYNIFTLVQKFFIIPFGFGAYHLFYIGSDVSRFKPLGAAMAVLVWLGMIAWVWREAIYPLAAAKKYSVESVKDLGADAIEVRLTPNSKPLKFEAGQFAYFKFFSAAVGREPHPFSIASAPDENALIISTKNLGDHTAKLKNLKPGDGALVYGPYGRFFLHFDDANENILIAGGIGITPFLSLLRAGGASDKTMLFYCANSDIDAVYDAELKTLAEKFKFKYFLHESGRRGLITAEIIEKRANGLTGKMIYLCGPKDMMTGFAKDFTRRGVLRRDIVFESFSY